MSSRPPSQSAADSPPVQRLASAGSGPAADIAGVGFPAGHLGHLTDTEQAAFGLFKTTAVERGLFDPAAATPSHRDEDLIRYLRARRWNFQDALKQFADTLAWRKANDIEVLYATIELDAYEQSRRVYPQWTGRRDKRGIPLYVFDVKTLDSKTVHNYEKVGASTTFSRAQFTDKTSPGLLRLFALYENLTRFCMPFCSQLRDREHAGTPITVSTNIVDVSGVGLKQFWSLKAHMQAASQLATAYYPETLDRIYIVGAPFFFPTVWGWIKKWFDPVTVSKIFILGPNDVYPTLSRFIDPANIPKQYGGGLDWKFGDMPTVDPAWDDVVEWAAAPSSGSGSGRPSGAGSFSTPAVWEEVDDGRRLACFGIGAVGGKLRRELICTIPKVWPAPSPPPPPSASLGAVGGTGDGARDTVSQAVSEGVQTDGPPEAQTPRQEAILDHDVITTAEALKNVVLGGEVSTTENEKTTMPAAEDVPAAVPTTIA